MKSIILFQPILDYYNLVARDIPLGLLSISRFLYHKYKIIIIDQRIKGWRDKLDEAIKEGPICFGVTSMTGKQIHFALEVSKYIKRKIDIPVIWGGVHPTLIPQQTLKNPYIDIVVEGEGDYVFSRLVEALDRGNNLDEIDGLWYKHNGKIKESDCSNGFLNLDQLPPIPYNLIEFSNYSGYSHMNFGNTFPVETGRGCPYRCAYCYNSAFKRGHWRVMPSDKIIEGIRHLMRWTKVDGIDFVDDNFFIDSKRTIEFIKLMRKERLNIKWGCETDINELERMDDEMLAELESAGLNWMSIGIESGSKRILEMVNKDTQIEDVIQANRRLAKFNFFLKYNFLCGYISEKNEELKKTISLILKILNDNPKSTVQCLGIIVPYPKTKYFEMAKEFGLNEPKRLEEWENFNPDDWFGYAPWLGRKDRNLLRTLHVASLFIDKKAYLNVSQKGFFCLLMRYAYKIYHRIARLRFRFLCSSFPLEVRLFDIFRKLFIR